MTISYGARGSAVEALQTKLQKAVGGPSVIDGIYGNDTEKVVGIAYRKFGVPGVSGAATDELLMALARAVGNTPIKQTPPGGSVTVTAFPPMSETTGKKVGMVAAAGIVGLVVWGMFKGKK